MSECVVRMEMPLDCERCPMCGTASCGNGMYELWCMCGDIPASSRKRPEDCPILCQLPEGHGRLVDAEALFERVYEYYGQDNEDNENWMMGMINGVPTIVPAEAERKVEERSET